MSARGLNQRCGTNCIYRPAGMADSLREAEMLMSIFALFTSVGGVITPLRMMVAEGGARAFMLLRQHNL
jgi:hypothetical protein